MILWISTCILLSFEFSNVYFFDTGFLALFKENFPWFYFIDYSDIELGNVEFEKGSRFEFENFVRQYFFYYVLLADSFCRWSKKHFRTRQFVLNGRTTLEICTKPKLLPEEYCCLILHIFPMMDLYIKSISSGDLRGIFS